MKRDNEMMKRLESNFLRWRHVELEEEQPVEEWQVKVWQQTVGSDVVKRFPVDREYELRFCKRVVAFCEEKGE